MPACHFYFSPQGCREGDDCRFSHDRSSLPSTRTVCSFEGTARGCREGERCKYLHASDQQARKQRPLAMQAQQQQMTMQQQRTGKSTFGQQPTKSTFGRGAASSFGSGRLPRGGQATGPRPPLGYTGQSTFGRGAAASPAGSPRGRTGAAEGAGMDAGASAAVAAGAAAFEGWSVKRMKQWLQERGVSFADCVEKSELVARPSPFFVLYQDYHMLP